MNGNDADGQMQSRQPYGYLLVHFKEDSHGYAERIYMDLSVGDDPLRWRPLNGGEPMLTSSLGTTGVRDPFIARNPVSGEYVIIATDLRVFGGNPANGTNWYDWSHDGSTNLMVWRSHDLVHWQGPQPLDVADLGGSDKPGDAGAMVGSGCSDSGCSGAFDVSSATSGSVGSDRVKHGRLHLGMAWASKCVWVPDFWEEGHQGGRGTFVMFWSSTLLDDADPHSVILWGTTTDFTQKTYRYGGVFLNTGGETIDATVTQQACPDGTVRTYRIAKDNSFGHDIWMDVTDAKRWWEPNARWSRVQANIGECYSDGHGVEGPAVFSGHGTNAGRHYLFVDVIPSVGYRPLVTDDLDSGWYTTREGRFQLSPHTKHGSVVSLTREEYDRLDGAL